MLACVQKNTTDYVPPYPKYNIGLILSTFPRTYGLLTDKPISLTFIAIHRAIPLLSQKCDNEAYNNCIDGYEIQPKKDLYIETEREREIVLKKFIKNVGCESPCDNTYIIGPSINQ